MHRQVGDLQINERGLAQRGLLLRHLVLPNGLAGTGRNCQFPGRARIQRYLPEPDGPVSPGISGSTLPEIKSPHKITGISTGRRPSPYRRLHRMDRREEPIDYNSPIYRYFVYARDHGVS